MVALHVSPVDPNDSTDLLLCVYFYSFNVHYIALTLHTLEQKHFTKSLLHFVTEIGIPIEAT